MTEEPPTAALPTDASDSAVEGPPRARSRFRTALEQGEFVVTLEAVPAASPGGRGVDSLLSDAQELAADGRVHAMSLTDNPGGGHAIMPDELAQEIQSAGLDCIVHFTCKDITRNGAISRGYALERMGLRNILALTGDYPKEGYWGLSKPAFDLDAVTLIKLLHDMNEGLVDVDPRKGTLAPPCDFFVGACVSPFKFTEAEQMTQYYKLHRKLDAGARFIISQLGYDMRKVQELRQYVELHGITTPIIGNVYVLNAGVARTMNRNQIPGAVVPDALLRHFETFPKGKEGRPRFLEHAAKMFAIVRGLGYQGVHLGGFGLKVEEVKEVLQRADDMQPAWQEHLREMVYPMEPKERQFYYFETDTATGLNATTPVDRKKLPNPKGRAQLQYRAMSVLHGAFFQPRTPGFRLAQRACHVADGNRLLKGAVHWVEKVSKEVTVDCRECGDCALPHLAYLCPDSACPKNLRNGPCGGSFRGKCEVYPDRDCVYVRAYNRLKAVGREEELRDGPMVTRNWELYRQPSWITYFLGRDHMRVDVPEAWKPKPSE
ncbi:MAG TPA: methylenetetrahydrofolate reductase C-terminal domain-containing protein [Dehalococcoidia bacterium]|nr:methylenetetrahydrofolate reductase C-terminal domain-containing protein [Dehalococcoidia bacterium]